MLNVVFSERAEISLRKVNAEKERTIFCFTDDFSIGNIEDKRNHSMTTLNALIQCSQSIESIRIFYSKYPNEYCGMCWLLYELKERMEKFPQIFIVQLPDQVEENGNIRKYAGWDEVNPDAFYNFCSFQKEASLACIESAISEWTEMQKENTSLRAMINGTLQSVSEDFYDYFIEKEISKMKEEFFEPALIGKVLGTYELGIQDDWISFRIDKMIEVGKLVCITKGNRRKLKKIKEEIR